MEPSEKFNCGVRIKKEPFDVSFTDNEYDIIDTKLDIKDFQFFKCPQKNPVHMFQKSDENHEGDLDELAIEFECQEGIEDGDGYQTRNKIKVETLGAVKKESFVDDDAKQLNMDFDRGVSEPSEKSSVTKEFTDNHRFDTQTITTRSGTDIACEMCRKKFSNKWNLKIHIDSIHNGITHACDTCEKSFAGKSNLKKHIDSVHAGIKHSCRTCGKKFSQRSYLKNHTITVHKGVPNVCHTCGKSFAAKNNLKVHIDSVHNGITHACDTCRKLFTSKTCLKHHIDSMHHKVTHKCDISGKSFSQKKNLKAHIVMAHR